MDQLVRRIIGILLRGGNASIRHLFAQAVAGGVIGVGGLRAVLLLHLSQLVQRIIGIIRDVRRALCSGWIVFIAAVFLAFGASLVPCRIVDVSQLLQQAAARRLMLQLQQLADPIIRIAAQPSIRQLLLDQTAIGIIAVVGRLVLRIRHLRDPVHCVIRIADGRVVRVDDPAALSRYGPFIAHIVAARINDRCRPVQGVIRIPRLAGTVCHLDPASRQIVFILDGAPVPVLRLLQLVSRIIGIIGCVVIRLNDLQQIAVLVIGHMGLLKQRIHRLDDPVRSIVLVRGHGSQCVGLVQQIAGGIIGVVGGAACRIVHTRQPAQHIIVEGSLVMVRVFDFFQIPLGVIDI
ncbi:hypothetical protein D3C81_256740 [compost metagenome]